MTFPRRLQCASWIELGACERLARRTRSLWYQLRVVSEYLVFQRNLILHPCRECPVFDMDASRTAILPNSATFSSLCS